MIKPLILGAASAFFLLTATSVQAGNHEKGEQEGVMLSAKVSIEKAVSNSAVRSAMDMERDQFRNPAATLNFFGQSITTLCYPA